MLSLEQFKCMDCGAILYEHEVVLACDEEKDSCPYCGSWVLNAYHGVSDEEEEDE